MTDKPSKAEMPAELKALVECGYAIWATDSVDDALRARFDSLRIPVVGVRHVRTQIPDEELWEVNLEDKNGSKYEFASTLLKPAPG